MIIYVPQLDPSNQFFFLTPASQPSQSSQPGNTSLSVTVEAIFKCVLTYPIIPSSSSLRGAVGVDFSCIDSNEGIKKKKNLSQLEMSANSSPTQTSRYRSCFQHYLRSIWVRKLELLNSLSVVSVKTQEAGFICKARIVEVLQQNGWSFILHWTQQEAREIWQLFSLQPMC